MQRAEFGAALAKQTYGGFGMLLRLVELAAVLRWLLASARPMDGVLFRQRVQDRQQPALLLRTNGFIRVDAYKGLNQHEVVGKHGRHAALDLARKTSS